MMPSYMVLRRLFGILDQFFGLLHTSFRPHTTEVIDALEAFAEPKQRIKECDNLRSLK
jgi:hypothetical protein